MVFLKRLLYKNIYFETGPLCVSSAKSGAAIKLFVNKSVIHLIDEIAARTTCDNEERIVRLKKSRSATGGFYAFSGKIPAPGASAGVRFKIYSKDNIYWLNARGVYAYHPNDYYDFRIASAKEAPAWVNKSVFYQIFPDRFWHGFNEKDYAETKELERKFNELYAGREIYFKNVEPRLKKWHELPDSKTLGYEFYFGTLEGIAQKKEYLKELGVNALYLTPIFKSPSNHRYDIIDYFEVDPVLGGNEGFKKFCEAMRGEKFRVVLDAVYNHSGFSNEMFKKARRGEKPYDEFYNFYGRKRERYACWLGHGSLPKLDYASEKLREIIYAGPRSASAKWLKPPYSIDGYRLDVAHMIGKNASAEGNIELLSEMKAAFKKYNPEAFVLAENFFDSYKMSESGCVDSVMNYHGFTFPVIAFLSKKDHRGRPNAISAEDARDWLMDCYAKLPQSRANIMYNQLSSHDISRHNSLLELDLKKITAALVFQFTLPGVPSIFYGDEIGLTGIGDPRCRPAMVWNESAHERNRALSGAYKKLIAARKKYDALAYGGFRIVYAAGGVICFIRKHLRETIISVINTSTKPAAPAFCAEELFLMHGISETEIIFDSTAHESPELISPNEGAKTHSGRKKINRAPERAPNKMKLSGAGLEFFINPESSMVAYIREE